MKIFILFLVLYAENGFVTVEKLGGFETRRDCEWAAVQVKSVVPAARTACIEVINKGE